MTPADTVEQLTPATDRSVIAAELCEGKGGGTSSGVNLAPGSDDDGWTVPQPVFLCDGTRLQLYKDGEALHAAYQAIVGAKRRICLQVYIWGNDDTGRAFAELMCRKAQKGVRCYVIYDSFGSIATDRAIFRRMRRAGVNVQEFHPLRPWETRYSWRPFNRDHRKLLIIDDHAAGLGGLNLGGEYAGSWVVRSKTSHCELWRDNAMGIVGPGARHFLQSFAKTWNYVIHGGRISRAELLHNCRFEEGELGIMAAVPSARSHVTPLVHDLFAGARESIELTMAYFAPPDDLIEELCAAARRGVRVRLMLPSKCDVKLLITAARSFYETLLTAGVEIYERQTVVLHGKTLLVDQERVAIGSTNLDYRSIEYNLEISALVKSREFGRQVHDLFEHDVRFARRILPTEWRKRPYLDRFGQWAVNRARYLL
ncbi:MAG TPA: phospholipase D-like domain-containing protein [Tepidisphaeraceae bacterium]|nr:phospholipase D-like domain-containing protein [Tepidisphaeraceae bacterium]